MKVPAALRLVVPTAVMLFAMAAGCTQPPSPALDDSGLPDAGRPDGGEADAAAATPTGLVDIVMRDGVALKTWIWLPSGPGPFPVFMVRNPYVDVNPSGSDFDGYARFFTDRGMAFVWQATRGTGGSGGVFIPYLSEVDDAKDTISWLLAQPACNGRIGVGGGSYLGYTAFAAAAADPHVVVVLSDDTGTDDEFTRHQGIVDNYLLSWWSLVERNRLANDTELQAVTNVLDPTTSDEAVLGRDLPYWNGALASGTAVYPPNASLRVLAPKICAAALHIVEGEVSWRSPRLAWEAIASNDCSRDRSWLVVAPESHADHFNAFGLADTWVTPDMLTMLEAFLLQTAPLPTWPRVRYRVESDEPTRAASVWPPPAALTTTFFLGAPGTPGEGTLSATPPAIGTWTMNSDPAGTDPCIAATDTWFTSAPLAEDLVLTGAPVLALSASTTALDFDVHVALYDYDAGPELYRSLGTGAVRARYRTGVDTPLPGTSPVALDVELTASARRVPAGHRLTLAIAPSRCECNENPHSGEPANHQTARYTAAIAFALGAEGARLSIPQVP